MRSFLSVLAGVFLFMNAQMILALEPEATPDPVFIPPITRNSDWTPLERDFDGVTMVLVPAGCFNMGSDIDMGIDDGFNDERPIHEICLDEPFWIDKYEVTQAQFQRLGGIQATAPGFFGNDRPTVNITWFEARDFCVLRGGRLPSEAEWEYAARGPESWVYPWGDAWDENNVVWNRSGSQGTESVGTIPAGISWVGALDMSGNVWEWTNSLYAGYPYSAEDGRERDTGTDTSILRVLRGGSWDGYGPVVPRASLRFGFFPLDGGVNIGFRCARSYDETSGLAFAYALLREAT